MGLVSLGLAAGQLGGSGPAHGEPARQPTDCCNTVVLHGAMQLFYIECVWLVVFAAFAFDCWLDLLGLPLELAIDVSIRVFSHPDRVCVQAYYAGYIVTAGVSWGRCVRLCGTGPQIPSGGWDTTGRASAGCTAKLLPQPTHKS